ncbi:hypothetical protein PL9631_250108 [Planktothrix paucivesiculata PCC 9631]|uniref:Uncharacterized protein n=1 Tax=Planktothrix paucivesiculata PCC 9631 TaxID=671071 RepID=A0A7Z9BLA4_9CYAN|nr:hypothetical protein PL9631_250108 [Planktothrix paucivesiculata PCC 9631]
MLTQIGCPKITLFQHFFFLIEVDTLNNLIAEYGFDPLIVNP